MAELLIRSVWSSGADWITFAGGDPSLRPDIVFLVGFAKQLGMKVEVQTNADEMSKEFERIVCSADQVGLSLDGPDAHTHDTFRDRPGNFSKVLKLLSELEHAGTQTVVRSVVAQSNWRVIPEIADLLASRSNVTRWSLLEFTPLGDGETNRDSYAISSEVFWSTVESSLERVSGRLEVDGFANSKKSGTYV